MISRFLSLLIILCVLGGCTQALPEFSGAYKVGEIENLVIKYDQGDDTYFTQVKFEKNYVVLRRGKKIKLDARELESINDFIICVETGEGFRLDHESGYLTLKIRSSKFSSYLWEGENVYGCVLSRVLRLGSDELGDRVDYNTAYWRDDKFNPYGDDHLLNRVE